MNSLINELIYQFINSVINLWPAYSTVVFPTWSGFRLGATWRSLLSILLTSAFHCVVCSIIALPSSACACVQVRNMVWFKAASIGWINVSLSVGHLPPRDLLFNYIDPVMLHRLLMHPSCHTVYPHLWIVFVKTFQKCQWIPHVAPC